MKRIEIFSWILLFIIVMAIFYPDQSTHEGFNTLDNMAHQIGFKPVYGGNTKHHKIDIIQFAENSHGYDKCVFLDKKAQFCNNHKRYHDHLVKVASVLLGKITNVLIIGGGDGQFIDCLTKFPDVKRIDVVDIDKSMMKIIKKHFNNELFPKDDRVSILAGDVQEMIESAPNKFYNLIIVDIRKEIYKNSTINNSSFLRLCRNKLELHDNLLIKCGGMSKEESKRNQDDEKEDTNNMRKIATSVKKTFPFYEAIKFKVEPFEQEYVYTLGSTTHNFKSIPPKISHYFVDK